MKGSYSTFTQNRIVTPASSWCHNYRDLNNSRYINSGPSRWHRTSRHSPIRQRTKGDPWRVSKRLARFNGNDREVYTIYICICCIAGPKTENLNSGDTICRGGLGILERGRQWRPSSVRRLVSDDDSSTLRAPDCESLTTYSPTSHGSRVSITRTVDINKPARKLVYGTVFSHAPPAWLSKVTGSICA